MVLSLVLLLSVALYLVGSCIQGRDYRAPAREVAAAKVLVCSRLYHHMPCSHLQNSAPGSEGGVVVAGISQTTARGPAGLEDERAGWMYRP